MSEIVYTPKQLPLYTERNIDAFKKFCSRLQRPLITGDIYIIALVNMFCYRNEMLQEFTTEVMLVTKGHGLGSIRISDEEQLFLSEDVHDLLESRTRQYALGRSGRALVIEDAAANSGCIFRVDLEENLN